MKQLCFLSINGSSQGLISEGAGSNTSIGDKYIEGHENEILVLSFKYGAANPAHTESGALLGKGRSKPFVIRKLIDKSSPLLSQTLSNGETLPKITLKAYRTAYNGKYEHYLTVELIDAHIVDIDCANQNETIYFTYKTMNINHVPASTMTESTWKYSPVIYDGPLIDRLVQRTIDNFTTTNRELYQVLSMQALYWLEHSPYICRTKFSTKNIYSLKTRKPVLSHSFIMNYSSKRNSKSASPQQPNKPLLEFFTQ
jgi:type VI secretion system secreted protein Hcp